MIFTDDSQPSHFTFANQIGVQTDEDVPVEAPTHDELSRTIESHLWLANSRDIVRHHPNNVHYIQNA